MPAEDGLLGSGRGDRGVENEGMEEGNCMKFT